MSSRIPLIQTMLTSTRRYTLAVIDRTDTADWFRMPPGGVTHIGWQVGHMVVSQFHLALRRVRGPRPGDEALVSESLIALFGRGSKPVPDAGVYPSCHELREVLDRVYAQVLTELSQCDDAILDEPPFGPEHPRFSSKLGAMLWCPLHEMDHVGQLALIWRMLGHDAAW
jgi:hypothetical protein